MVWPFKSANAGKSAPPGQVALCTEYHEAGVVFSAMPAGWLDAPYRFGEQNEQVALLAQLAEEGFAEPDGDALRLPWDSLYQLLESEDYQASISLLGLPPLEAWRPKLESRSGLTDTSFSILLAGWID